MAEWAWEPMHTYPIQIHGPTMLRTPWEDKTVSRRRKSNATGYSVREIHYVNKTTAAAMKALYKTKGLDLPLTKVTYDPEQADATEGNFVFLAEPRIDFFGPGAYQVIADFDLDL